MTTSTDFIMNGFTTLGSIEFIASSVFVLVLILLYGKYFRDATWFLLLNYGGIALNFILKVLFGRDRPGAERAIEAFHGSFEVTSYSFPSGHTMRASLFFLSLGYILFTHFNCGQKLKWIVIVFFSTTILLVASSRVYLNHHYISDAVGAVIASLLFFLSMIIIKKKYFDQQRRAVYETDAIKYRASKKNII
ncbi:phosphatase PAP2 family protein [Salipaludibacillus sp. CF4.18]|uniref:phosphatase PAP2 family protein n=1 Tax=Salipaludibacillus sp. CF4.18 TaxID=3373081 RepID=UPI003EE74921